MLQFSIKLLITELFFFFLMHRMRHLVLKFCLMFGFDLQLEKIAEAFSEHETFAHNLSHTVYKTIKHFILIFAI